MWLVPLETLIQWSSFSGLHKILSHKSQVHSSQFFLHGVQALQCTWMSNSTYFETYAARLLCNYIQSIPTIFLWIELLFGGFYRLSVEVKRAVGQGGGRGCTLLYSLRLWPERLQAVAPGCCHFALATWIHRQSDPWLTLQRTLSTHSIQQYTLLLLQLALVLRTCQI